MTELMDSTSATRFPGNRKALQSTGRSRTTGSTRRRGLLFVSLSPVLIVAFVGYVHIGMSFDEPLELWSDAALIEITVRRAAGFEQLLGAYSRFGWHHPGPAYFYGLAPFETLLGPRGMLAGTWTINMAACLATVLAIRRAAGHTAACFASVVLVGLVASMPMAFNWAVWNPMVVTMPLVLVAVLAARAWTGSVPSSVGALLVGSFVLQAHVGMLPIVSASFAFAVIGIVVGSRTRRRSDRRSREREASDLGRLASSGARLWVAATVAGLLLIWLPPITEEVASGATGGNFSALAKFALDPGGRTTYPPELAVFDSTIRPGATGVARTVVQQTTSFPLSYDLERSVVSDSYPISWPRLACFVALSVCATAIVVRRRRVPPIASPLATWSLVGLVATIFAVSMSAGPQYWFLSHWAAAVFVPTALAGGVVLASAIESQPEAGRPRGLLAALAALVVVVASVALFRSPVDETPRSAERVDPTGYRAAEFLRDRFGVERGSTILAVPTSDTVGWRHLAAMAAGFDRVGVKTNVVDDWLFIFGDDARTDGSEQLRVSLVSEGSEVPEELRKSDGPVARFGEVDLWVVSR